MRITKLSTHTLDRAVTIRLTETEAHHVLQDLGPCPAADSSTATCVLATLLLYAIGHMKPDTSREPVGMEGVA